MPLKFSRHLHKGMVCHENVFSCWWLFTPSFIIRLQPNRRINNWKSYVNHYTTGLICGWEHINFNRNAEGTTLAISSPLQCLATRCFAPALHWGVWSASRLWLQKQHAYKGWLVTLFLDITPHTKWRILIKVRINS